MQRRQRLPRALDSSQSAAGARKDAVATLIAIVGRSGIWFFGEHKRPRVVNAGSFLWPVFLEAIGLQNEIQNDVILSGKLVAGAARILNSVQKKGAAT